MDTLFIVLVNFCLTFGQNYEQEDTSQTDRTILPLNEGLKQHLESDSVTSTILASIYSQNFSEEVINLLHLSMNNFLITSSLLILLIPSLEQTITGDILYQDPIRRKNPWPVYFPLMKFNLL